MFFHPRPRVVLRGDQNTWLSERASGMATVVPVWAAVQEFSVLESAVHTTCRTPACASVFDLHQLWLRVLFCKEPLGLFGLEIKC